MTLLLALIVVAPLALAWWFGTRPVSAGQIARFERRHHIAATPEVARYLTFVRRWRALGVACGHVIGLTIGLPEHRVEASPMAMAGGWLVGALLAEASLAVPGGGELPGWMRRVPGVLTGAAVGGTVLTLALGEWPMVVLAWGVGMLACAGAVLVALRYIDGRPPDSPASADGPPGPASVAPGPEGSVAAAVGRHSAGAIIAVGTVLALACLGRQIAAISVNYYDTVAGAVTLVGAIVALGGLGVGSLLTLAARPPLRFVSIYIGVLTLLSAGVLSWAWLRDRAPYPASSVQASAAIRMTDEKQFEADARSVGAAGLQPIHDAPGQQIVGRLDYRMPAAVSPEATYTVALIDKRQNRLADYLVSVDGGGWNGFMSALAQRYGWLSAMDSPRTADGGYGEPGMTVSRRADQAGPITFSGYFSGGDGLTAGDIMVVLIFTGPQNQTYWVQRVAG